ncbi:MAG: type II toxin-antitoxin system VapC family toxin [Candidatus Kapaibacterium sp.]
MVLDAQPLSILFHEQPGWEIVADTLQRAVDRNEVHLLSSINLGEVFYSILRVYGEADAQKALARIRRGPIDIIVPSIEQTLVAGRFKAGGGISYADCFAGALALERNLPVLTGDKEFERLIPFGVKIEWLPEKM